MRIQSYTSFGILVAIITYTLYIGKSFLIPLILSFFLWFIIISLAKMYRNISIGGFKIPYSLSMFLAIVSNIMLVYLTIKLISANISEIKETLPLYQEKLSHTLVSISLFFGVDESIANIPSMLKSLNFKNLVATTLEVANGIISSTFTIFIYLMFLLLEYKTFDKKLKAIFTTDAQYSQAKYIVDSISADVMTYFKIKTTISLALAILVYAILEIVGVNFASFWAILTFLLNFIPTFGSIIATIFPVIMALVQFDTLYPMVIVFSSLIGLQFVLGNIIEPKISGESLNLSPMVIMLSLVLWGEIWGVIGMLLCVPMMVVLNIILSNFEQTKWIAIIFSEDGEIRHAKVEKNI